ncbi:PTS sugar transporter subunit IIB [Lactovum odontotermitis]
MSKSLNILVACGSGVATSTLAAEEVKAVLAEYGLQGTISKTSMQEIENASKNADIVLTTNNYKGDLGKPLMSIAGFITGINEDKLRKNLGELLTQLSEA